MFNRRNALFGWVVWQVAKRVARRKARAVVPAIDTDTKRPNRSAIVLVLAALVGAAAWFRSREAGEGDGDSLG